MAEHIVSDLKHQTKSTSTVRSYTKRGKL